MNIFSTKFVDGHIIVDINNSKYIVDTGSPSSFGRGISIIINEKTFPINSIGLGRLTADSISSLSKLEVDGLIGNDILIHFDVRFTKSRIIFSDTVISYSLISIKLPIIERCMGVPIIILNIGGKDRRIFFDTGAKLSYLSEDLLLGATIGEMEDFYPSIGNFKTKIYKIDVIINGKVETLTFGSLPSSILMLLEMGQTKGIIGTQLLNKYSIILSNLNKMLVLESNNEEDIYNSDNQSLQTQVNQNFVLESSLD